MIAKCEVAPGETLTATLDWKRSAAITALCHTEATALGGVGMRTCVFARENGSGVMRAVTGSIAALERQDFITIGAVLANGIQAMVQQEIDCEVSLLPNGGAEGVLARLTPTVVAPLNDLASRMADALALANDPEAQAARWKGSAENWPSISLFGMLRRAARESGVWLDLVIDDARRTLVADVVASAVHAAQAERCALDLALRYGPYAEGRLSRLETLQGALPTLLGAADSCAPMTELQTRRSIIRSKLLAVLGSENDSPIEWIRTGIALQRVLLLACGAGLGATVHTEVAAQPHWRNALAALVFARGYPQIVVHFAPRA